MEMTDGEMIALLRRRGLVDPATAVELRALPGGVSGDVREVACGGVGLVIKRAHAALRVQDEWLADEERLITEGWALRLARDLAPGSVPEVLDLDVESLTLVLERAPDAWTNWRDDLLAGTVDPAVGERLGEILATWHRLTAERPRLLASFSDRTAFRQLRIDPFHHRIAERHPDLAPSILAVAEDLLGPAHTLVHGDFSPKNVLVGENGLWVLDWEVAHAGDPVFDLAYLVCHLTLKAVHRPQDAPAYRETARRFLAAYGATPDARLAANVGCLLLARVDGKSPADYLGSVSRARTRELGRAVLQDPGALEPYV
jgi:tRNA A-37 threonylcarbamoyl transferase component Bud32